MRLQGQPVQILEILLEKPGQLVTREELRERLWTSDTFVDFDHSLNTAIKKLRQALGNEADTPRYIETLPRRGYRFVGEVRAEGILPENSGARAVAGDEVVAKVRSNEGDAAINAAGSRRQGLRLRWMVAAAIVGAATIAAVYWLFRPLPMPHIVASHALTKSKNRKGSYQGLLLTDGANLYFQERELGKLKTMQVRIKGGEASELTIRTGDLDSLRDISKDGSELLLSVYDSEAHSF